MSDSLRSHEPQYTRPPCLSPTPVVYPNLSIESVMPPNHLILCRPLLFLPSIFPSIRVFSNESVLHIRWPKYWSFSFSISPSSEHPGLISFRMDWLDILAVQGILKSLLQHCSSKASILQHSAFFIGTLQGEDPLWSTDPEPETDATSHVPRLGRRVSQVCPFALRALAFFPSIPGLPFSLCLSLASAPTFSAIVSCRPPAPLSTATFSVRPPFCGLHRISNPEPHAAPGPTTAQNRSAD